MTISVFCQAQEILAKVERRKLYKYIGQTQRPTRRDTQTDAQTDTPTEAQTDTPTDAQTDTPTDAQTDTPTDTQKRGILARVSIIHT